MRVREICEEGERERYLGGGGMRLGTRDPYGSLGAGRGRGASPALPKCKARIKLLYRARLRGIFWSNSALLIRSDRANKHVKF
jgi:hypothetical protein